MTFSADMNLGNEFRLLTELTFSFTEVHTCLVMPVSAFRYLGRFILMFTLSCRFLTPGFLLAWL